IASAAGHADLALRHDLLGEGSALAAAHGTRWPLVQGPMTHVSDRAGFVDAVARQGALPMAALSLMKGDAARALLTETAAMLGDRPWGVGLLGFVPPDVLAEQQAAIAESRPRFAIIAGGRPEQAAGLESAGIRTYLHVPSPVLLEQFVEQGARHFVFEGRECGGHIGPLSSFTLWELMIEAVLANPIAGLHVLLAGGIHDSRSAAMAATAAAPLAEKGVRVGFLMGTGYCFTAEAVATGAVTESFQSVAVGCRRTIELVNGPGHASRVADTAIACAFADRKAEMERQGASVAAIKDALESFSLGRLRLATKGLMRAEGARELSARPVDEQLDGGMFMIGQVAALRDSVLGIADLHRAVTAEAAAFLQSRRIAQPMPAAPPPADVAVVGIGTLLPGAKDARRYWENILDKVLAIREVPADRWDAGLFFDAERSTRDKVYSRWGGFLDEVVFDPVRFGMPPSSLGAIDPMQLLALAAVRQALDDQAGTADEPRRTSVILGFSGGLGEMGLQYGARAELPRLVPGLDDSILARLPEWTEDSFAGLLPNVSAGRVANRFDFGGVNLTVDAACASSLAAIYQSVLELQSGRSDRVVTGGVDTLQNPFGFLCFSKTQALSPTGACRTFDQSADGIAIAEGLAIVVLKRLADAERDGDQIYAVIKGVGGSSDGRVKGLTAPL
ncbi:MAG: nitronate monooxygenase, partial [Alphaproteobacteria bacterium]|nr:nitronate monooxygenase [Alphaproteobacteria bacterium]